MKIQQTIGVELDLKTLLADSWLVTISDMQHKKQQLRLAVIAACASVGWELWDERITSEPKVRLTTVAGVGRLYARTVAAQSFEMHERVFDRLILQEFEREQFHHWQFGNFGDWCFSPSVPTQMTDGDWKAVCERDQAIFWAVENHAAQLAGETLRSIN